VTSGVRHPREELIPNLRDTFKTVAVRCNKSDLRFCAALSGSLALLELGQFV
jgi:hypothetical protein